METEWNGDGNRNGNETANNAFLFSVSVSVSVFVSILFPFLFLVLFPFLFLYFQAVLFVSSSVLVLSISFGAFVPFHFHFFSSVFPVRRDEDGDKWTLWDVILKILIAKFSRFVFRMCVFTTAFATRNQNLTTFNRNRCPQKSSEKQQKRESDQQQKTAKTFLSLKSALCVEDIAHILSTSHISWIEHDLDRLFTDYSLLENAIKNSFLCSSSFLFLL